MPQKNPQKIPSWKKISISTIKTTTSSHPNQKFLVRLTDGHVSHFSSSASSFSYLSFKSSFDSESRSDGETVRKAAGSAATPRRLQHFAQSNTLLGLNRNNRRAGSPFSQDLQMREPQAPAPHHPRCVESSEETPSNPRPQRPERLQKTERKGVTLLQQQEFLSRVWDFQIKRLIRGPYLHQAVSNQSH